MAAVLEPPFGTHALPAWAETLRRAAQRAGTGPLARRAASLIRRICLVGRSDPVDVEPFPGQRARLYPRDNLSEKRVFGGVQFWDAAERAALQAAMADAPRPFCFVDAGANAGLYSLAVRSFGPALIVAVEPDAENLRRLRDNLEASGATEVTVAPVALSDRPGFVRIAAATGNRGETSVTAAEDGIPARPLLEVVRAAGLPRIDALKIDIEGAELPVLRAFFETAPPTLHPALILIEARRGEETEALAHLRATGYSEAARTKMNAIIQAGPSRQSTGGQNGQA
ncbi:MAG: FkbM family methyltransferase [Pseudomonadota bacterium]